MECMRRFVDLANTMKNEGIETKIVSAGLMTASGVYATYAAVGNRNRAGLTASGVDKVVALYRQHLERVQEIRREESGGAG